MDDDRTVSTTKRRKTVKPASLVTRRRAAPDLWLDVAEMLRLDDDDAARVRALLKRHSHDRDRERAFDFLHERLWCDETTTTNDRPSEKTKTKTVDLATNKSFAFTATCPRCRHTKARVTQRQTRAADEGATAFFQCGSCSHVWRGE